MSVKRQAAIAEIDSQIAQVELLKAQGQSATTPEEQIQRQQDILKAQKGILKAEESEETVYTKAAIAARKQAASIKLTGGKLNQWAANIPTPGTYWTPLIILLFLYLILFSVNGHSRMGWFGLVLTGNAELATTSEITRTPSNTATQSFTTTTQQANTTPETSGEQPKTQIVSSTNKMFLNFLGSTEV